MFVGGGIGDGATAVVESGLFGVVLALWAKSDPDKTIGAVIFRISGTGSGGGGMTAKVGGALVSGGGKGSAV